MAGTKALPLANNGTMGKARKEKAKQTSKTAKEIERGQHP